MIIIGFGRKSVAPGLFVVIIYFCVGYDKTVIDSSDGDSRSANCAVRIEYRSETQLRRCRSTFTLLSIASETSACVSRGIESVTYLTLNFSMILTYGLFA